MDRVKFCECEITGELVTERYGTSPVFKTPVTPKENYFAMFNGENPLWMPMTSDCKGIDIKIDPDNIARAFVFEYEPFDNTSDLGLRPDMFGVNWQYVPKAGGSMVPGGTPLLEDANEWKEKVVFPDVNAWDWEGSAKANAPWFEQNKDYVTGITFLNGTTFERLISFMDFMGAAMAIIDDDQKDAVIELCDNICERVYFPYLENCKKWFPTMDKVTLHDDWGSQMAPFFSAEAARNIILPEMKRLVDHVHAKGYPCELHSCGHVEDRCDIFAEAGFDSWTPMPMNDTAALMEKYGDRIAIGLTSIDDLFDLKDSTEEEQRAAARAFVDRFVRPDKVGLFKRRLNYVTDAFIEELYKQSRIRYAQLFAD